METTNTSFHGHTCKLYYNRYMWKVKLLIPCNEGRTRSVKNVNKLRQDAILPISSWLENHAAGNYRLLKSWKKVKTRILNVISKKPKIKSKVLSFCHYTVFINNEKNYQDMLDHFKDLILVSYCPANKSHEELIRDGNIIDVKENLYFGRFRYKISFWGGGWNRRWSTNGKTADSLTAKELDKLIQTHLFNESKDVDDQDYYLIPSNRSLYIKHKSDYTMIKLAMGDNVKKITVVALPTEILSELIV